MERDCNDDDGSCCVTSCAASLMERWWRVRWWSFSMHSCLFRRVKQWFHSAHMLHVSGQLHWRKNVPTQCFAAMEMPCYRGLQFVLMCTVQKMFVYRVGQKNGATLVFLKQLSQKLADFSGFCILNPAEMSHQMITNLIHHTCKM